MLNELKEYIAKRKEPTQMEQVDKSILDSIQSRPMLEDEAGNIIEDTQYLNDLIGMKERTAKMVAEEKREKRLIKLPELKLDPQVTSQIIRTGGEILVAGSGIAWGVLCLIYDKDGEIVPSRIFAFCKQLVRK